MNFMTAIDIKPLVPHITYKDKIMLIGSCFTEHIGNSLQELKFQVLQNPNGILFEPASVCNSLLSYIENYSYTADDLFYYNELWQSWAHHSRFSNPDVEAALSHINAAQQKAHAFIKSAHWLIITLGSSFTYILQDTVPSDFRRLHNRCVAPSLSQAVANCHKAPGQWFEKYLIPIEEQMAILDNTLHRLLHFNPQLKIIFTISPVRHLRDGVVDNNRSKARLIEVVHQLVNKFEGIYYFPAYELVIDVLRDYRFYDIDLAHPNYAATSFVMEKFASFAFDESTRGWMKEIRQLVTARNHKPFHPTSQQHKKFLQQNFVHAQQLAATHPYLDFTDELAYFGSGQQN